MTETLAAALEREHQEIDSCIEDFLNLRERGESQTAPLSRALLALRRHIYLEEEFVFPPLRDAGMVMPIHVMLREHGEIWATMDVIDAHLAGRPDEAPGEEICRALLAQLERHNSKEEAIIYPRAHATLGAELDTQLRGFLDTGEMPLGWRPGQHGGVSLHADG